MENEKLMCRICLTEDVRMHSIINTHLQEMFEKLSETPLETDDNRPQKLCYLCHKKLQLCYKLRMSCLWSEDLFTQLKNNLVTYDQLIPLPHQLAVSRLSYTSYTDRPPTPDDNPVKMELEEYENDDMDIKQEDIEGGPNATSYTNFNGNDTEDNLHSPDSDDDLPLKIMKNESERKLRRKKRLRMRKRDDDMAKTFKIDASTIILSKEEQISNLAARANSQNYLRSPYKCHLCYKGFVDSKAYDNHMKKHDETSGAYSCEVCRLRYRTAQQVRTHTVSAHSRLFRCNKCEFTTHTANQARVHEKWHSGFTYECQLCSHKFRKPTSYLSHMRKRHPTEHICNVCGESFVGQHGLQMHKSKTHRLDNLQENTMEPSSERFCNECDILFYSREAWKRHILCSVRHILKTESSTECSICGWRGTSSALATHMREHSRTLRQRRRPTSVTDRSSCRCTQCGVTCVSSAKLQAHVNRIHLGLKYNKNIVCEVCGKHCTSNATLKYHQRTHTGERPYTCSTCAKQFSDSNQLRIHIRTHTGEKPYACAVCGKRFSQKPALNRHYRIHTGDKPYSCTHCSRTFSQSNSLKLHVRTVHLKLPANTRKRCKKTTDNMQAEKIDLNENV